MTTDPHTDWPYPLPNETVPESTGKALPHAEPAGETKARPVAPVPPHSHAHDHGHGHGSPMDIPAPEGEGQASAMAGEPLAEGTAVASEERVVEALKTVYDPEIPVDIYELGLIYTLDIKPTGNVDITMSLTAPACPVAGAMPGMVANAVAAVDGIGVVNVELVWDPPWTMERMSEDAKIALGMG